jgi:hypothetical protein
VLVTDCIDAALCIVDTCRLLQNTIGLGRASYTEFSALRVALLVILSQFLDKSTNVDRFRQPLFEGMAMLKSMSTWGASARFDVSLIEAFEHAIAKMEAREGDRPPSPRESDYDMFKKWEMGQNGPKSAAQQTPRDDKAFDPTLGIPSLVGNAADAWDSALPRSSSMSMPGGAFNMDGSFPSMPMLESLSATLAHGYGFPGDLDGSRSNNWMGL